MPPPFSLRAQVAMVNDHTKREALTSVPVLRLQLTVAPLLVNGVMLSTTSTGETSASIICAMAAEMISRFADHGSCRHRYDWHHPPFQAIADALGLANSPSQEEVTSRGSLL